YVEKFKLSHPTDSIEFLLPEISKRIGALQKYGEYDLNKSAMFFIKQYRNGKYGRYTLDDVSPEGLKAYFTGGDGSDKDVIMSKNQRKKLEWEKVMVKRLNRWKKHGYLTGKDQKMDNAAISYYPIPPNTLHLFINPSNHIIPVSNKTL
ncbi:hypothetical protein C2G38_2228645, partial [Gigaspora rosea]